jgi:ABC-type spermidine/putrescine transport system permease subunit II
MTATMTRPDTVPADLRRDSLSWTRRFMDQLVRGLIWFCLLVAIVPLGLVTYYVIVKGGSTINWAFLTDRIPRQPQSATGGIGPAIVGTLLVTGVAALIAIPLGVLGAIYLNEYGKNSALARTIRTMSDVMTGVPSIMMGLFIYLGVVLVFGEKNALAGGLALACLMLAVVIRSSEEMLRLVPDELRQASLALGARKWRTTLTVVLAGRPLGDHERRAARDRPRGRRDGAHRARGRVDVPHELEPLRRQHGATRADLQQRAAALPRGREPGLGRGADPGRDRTDHDSHRPLRGQSIRDQGTLRACPIVRIQR